jgi:hypothetical protein
MAFIEVGKMSADITHYPNGELVALAMKLARTLGSRFRPASRRR